MLKELYDPPTEEEVAELRALLMSDRVSAEGMTLSEVDGFITGLVVSPEPPPPNEWVPEIFGDELPAWKDDDEAGQFGSIVLRRSFQIANGLDDDPPRFEPWLDRDAEAKPDPTNWATGFMRAIALAPDRWVRMMKDPEGSLFLLPVVAFSAPEPDENEGEDDLPFADAEVEAALAATREEIGDEVEEALAACVIGTRAYWLDAATRPKTGAPKKKRVKHKPPRRRR
ncbi:MAG: YecA family protein [Rhodopila sp.]